MALSKFVVRYGRVLLHFGPGSTEVLESWVSAFKRVYVITGRNAARVSGALRDVVSAIEKGGARYEIFDEVFANPTATIVDKAAEGAWRFGAEALIAVGGGSVIDAAKIASVIVACGGRALEYLKRVRDVCDAIGVAVVNLTHGTGSEVNRYAVATVEDVKVKLSIASEHIYPTVSIDDPRYALTLPKNQVVYTSLDAFYHALESSTGRFSTPFARLLGEQAIELISRWLPVAAKNPEDLEARYWLLYASAIAGIAVDNARTHLIHSIEHVLSGLEPRLAHGAGLAILGPAAIEVLYRHAPEALHRVLRLLDPSLEPNQSCAPRAANVVKRFQESVGFSESLSDYGFSAEMADKVSEMVFRYTKYLMDLAPIDVERGLVKEIYLRSLRMGGAR